MRIVGGARRGLRLVDVGTGDEAARLRPTADRVREAIFNLLAHGGYGDPVPGARVLDLFAGSGALGLEALSRGAAATTFVETGRAALALLRANIVRMKASKEAQVLERDATRLGPNPGPPFELVFLDPPYGLDLGAAAIAAAGAGGWIAPGALLLWEERATMTPPSGLTLLDARRYGGTMISLFRNAPA